MPVNDWPMPEHLKGEWNVFDESTGQMNFKVLTPEDVLLPMSEGYTVEELVEMFHCPSEVMEHVIACIPEMMAWKSKLSKGAANGARSLPRLPLG